MIGGMLAGGAERPAAAGGAPDLRYQIVQEILDLLEASCADGPVVLVLEDIHWADDSTLLAFRSMARRLAHVPLLLVSGSSDRSRPQRKRRGNSSPMSLAWATGHRRRPAPSGPGDPDLTILLMAGSWSGPRSETSVKRLRSGPSV
jgi:hypothetical protein